MGMICKLYYVIYGIIGLIEKIVIIKDEKIFYKKFYGKGFWKVE